jgi:hypothetical protein
VLLLFLPCASARSSSEQFVQFSSMANTRSASIVVSAAALVLLLVASQATAARPSLGAAAAGRQLLQDKQQQCFDAFNQYGECWQRLVQTLAELHGSWRLVCLCILTWHGYGLTCMLTGHQHCALDAGCSNMRLLPAPCQALHTVFGHRAWCAIRCVYLLLHDRVCKLPPAGLLCITLRTLLPLVLAQGRFSEQSAFKIADWTCDTDECDFAACPCAGGVSGIAPRVPACNQQNFKLQDCCSQVSQLYTAAHDLYVNLCCNALFSLVIQQHLWQ